MNANEMVIVARIADHYEGHVKDGQDPLEVAKHDFIEFKQRGPKLWSALYYNQSLSSREIGDQISDFLIRCAKSGKPFRICIEDEMERLGIT